MLIFIQWGIQMTTFLFQAAHILMVLNEINSLVVVQCTYTGVEISLWGDDRLVFTPHLKFLFIDKYGDHISTLLDTHGKARLYS